MDRRRFLRLTGASSLLCAAPAAGWGRPRPPLEPEARPALLSMLGDPARVRELGRRYRSMMPEEKSREALLSALRSEPDSTPTEEGQFKEQIRDDFASGRVVTLDGWVLSRTEARQCALFSLTCKRIT